MTKESTDYSFLADKSGSTLSSALTSLFVVLSCLILRECLISLLLLHSSELELFSSEFSAMVSCFFRAGSLSKLSSESCFIIFGVGSFSSLVGTLSSLECYWLSTSIFVTVMPLFSSMLVLSSRVSSLDAKPGPSASGVEFILFKETASNVLSDLLIDFDLSAAVVKSDMFENCFRT